jgi:hypothetical protein
VKRCELYSVGVSRSGDRSLASISVLRPHYAERLYAVPKSLTAPDALKMPSAEVCL